MVKNKKRGRKTKITDECVKKLIEYFHIDCTVSEACSAVGISRESFYNRLESDSEFRDKIHDAQNFPFIYAKQQYFSTMGTKDKGLTQRSTGEFLKRRHPDWKDKKEVTVNTPQPLTDEDIASLNEIRNRING